VIYHAPEAGIQVRLTGFVGMYTFLVFFGADNYVVGFMILLQHPVNDDDLSTSTIKSSLS